MDGGHGVRSIAQRLAHRELGADRAGQARRSDRQDRKGTGLLVGAVESRAKLAEDELRRSLEANKLYAAENIATEGRVTQAVNRVDDAVKRLTDRIDRYFEPESK